MNKDEALKMAIEALERYGDAYGGTDGDFEALKACKEALEQDQLNLSCKSVQKRLATQWGYVEQPLQEPMAIIMPIYDDDPQWNDVIDCYLPPNTKLYTHPAPSWQGLSDDEIRAIDDVTLGDYYVEELATKFARAIEQALKEKNYE